MKNLVAILDAYLEKHRKDYLTAVEAARVLDRAGVLKDSDLRPGKPLRDRLRKASLPHAYQLGGEGSKWVIPHSPRANDVESAPETQGLAKPQLAKVSELLSTEECERLRARYRPETVKVLFVGESRPAGGTFFYAGNSILYFQTKEAFEKKLERAFGSADEFLSYFKEAGCFLDDLCLEPVNRVTAEKRGSESQSGVSVLAEKIREYNPEHVICVLKRIAPYVRQALDESRITLVDDLVSLPFPAMGHQEKYKKGLRELFTQFHLL